MLMLTNSSFMLSRRRCSFLAVFNSLTFRTVCSLFPWPKKKGIRPFVQVKRWDFTATCDALVRQERSIFPLWQEVQLATAAKHLGVGRVLHPHHSSGSEISKYESKNDHNPSKSFDNAVIRQEFMARSSHQSFTMVSSCLPLDPGSHCFNFHMQKQANLLPATESLEWLLGRRADVSGRH